MYLGPMTPEERIAVVYHCDTGSCFEALVERLCLDPDIFDTTGPYDANNRIHAESLVRQAMTSGMLRGDETWLKVTKSGWTLYNEARFKVAVDSASRGRRAETDRLGYIVRGCRTQTLEAWRDIITGELQKRPDAH